MYSNLESSGYSKIISTRNAMNGNDISWRITHVYIYIYVYIQASMFRSTSPWSLPRKFLRPCWYKGVPGVKLLNPYDGLRWSGVFSSATRDAAIWTDSEFMDSYIDLCPTLWSSMNIFRHQEIHANLRSSTPKEHWDPEILGPKGVEAGRLST